jgi:MerR family transcriptional regulator, light-induced transcriptional regulator
VAFLPSKLVSADGMLPKSASIHPRSVKILSMDEAEGLIRIGELGRRLGVSPDRLRAWERRYGLLRPVRTPGGFRLYSDEDARRVREMQAQLERGLSAAEAAGAVLASRRSPAPSPPLHDARAALAAALAAFDDVRANALLDRLFAVIGSDVAMRDVIYPCLRALGEAWERAEIDVGQEHFASNLLHERLLGLVPAWEQGRGARAVLACPAGEHHSLALTGLGVSMRNRGWRVTFLGADTPVAMIARSVERVSPQLVVLAATMAHLLPPIEGELRELAGSAPLHLAGAGAGPALAERVGAEFLDVDPVTAAERLTAG